MHLRDCEVKSLSAHPRLKYEESTHPRRGHVGDTCLGTTGAQQLTNVHRDHRGAGSKCALKIILGRHISEFQSNSPAIPRIILIQTKQLLKNISASYLSDISEGLHTYFPSAKRQVFTKINIVVY